MQFADELSFIFCLGQLEAAAREIQGGQTITGLVAQDGGNQIVAIGVQQCFVGECAV